MEHRTIVFALVAATLPSASAQWIPLSSGLQSTRSLTELNGDLYAAVYINGIKKSTNNGVSWNTMTSGLPNTGGNYSCESVGDNGSFLFTGTHDGIYRSDDGGITWEVANGTLTANNTVYANKWFVFGGITMAVFKGSVAGGGGIWRTGNNGDDWFIGHSGMGSNVEVHHLAQAGSTLWASTSVGLYTSTDNGLNWTAFAAVNYATYALAPAGGNLVILSTFGYRYSTNGGTTWNDATGDPASPTSGELAMYDNVLYAKTGVGAGTGCVRSVDNGLTWTAWNTGLGAIDQVSLEEFHLTTNRIYVTALFDIYYITGIGVGMPRIEAPEVTLHPTVFSEGFTITGDRPLLGEVILVHPWGAVAVRGVINGETAHLDRGTLAAGVYRCLFIPAFGGITRDLGAVIAR